MYIVSTRLRDTVLSDTTTDHASGDPLGPFDSRSDALADAEGS